MKNVPWILATLLLTACATVTPPISVTSPATRALSDLPNQYQQLQGVWEVRSAQRGSTPMNDKIGVRAHIEGNRFWFDGDSGFEILDIDTTVEPYRVDFWEKGTAVQGVFRIASDTLVVCSAPPGVARPAGLDSRAHSRYITFEAQRVREK
jgi:uncharacterized protein (TIGR03067 family)